MKKSIVTILILALAAPALALICHCCPVVKTQPSQISIQKASCPYCEIVDVKRDHGRLNGIENLATRFEQIPGSQVLSHVEDFVLIDDSNHDFGQERAGPVRFSSETPLYLAHQILRL